MCRVLIVGEDRATIGGIGEALGTVGHKYRASGGPEASALLRVFQPDIVLIDVALPDMSWMEVLREVRHMVPWTACIMMGNCRSIEALIHSMRGGARDWLDKPLSQEELLAAVKRVRCGGFSAGDRGMCLPPATPHAQLRLAYKAVEFIASPNDAPTLPEFARMTGVSVAGFRNWCRTAGEQSRAYLQFARALRAVFRRAREPSESLENLLQIVDKRTLTKFIAANGGTRAGMPVSVDALLRSQRLISNRATDAVRLALADRRIDA